MTNVAGGNASDIGAYETPVFEVNSTADTDDGACTRRLKGTLPETGDYQIIVDGDERGGSYSMTITIK